MRENYNLDQTVITYERTGQSTNTDALGMREMQARVYEKRQEQYLLVKAPPASGTSQGVWPPVSVFYYNKKYGRIGHLFQDRFRSEPCNTPEYFFTLFRYIHQNPVKAGLVKLAQDYPYSSWPNDYLSLGQERVCFTRAAVKRFGLDELAAWVDEPLPENVGCLDMDERKVVADELVRDLLLQKSGTRNIAEFRLLDKERQKEYVREVMLELEAGPRQMSRVSGLSYGIIQHIKSGIMGTGCLK